MKKVLLIIGLFVFAGSTNIWAQSESSNAEESVENAAVLAEKAAASDENIEKKVCQKSGKVSYVRKDVCEKSGKVSYTDLVYDPGQGKFVAREETAKKGKACGSKAKAGGCCASKGKAKGVSAKEEKACCAAKAKEGKACCSSKNKAKAAKAKPALTPQG